MITLEYALKVLEEMGVSVVSSKTMDDEIKTLLLKHLTYISQHQSPAQIIAFVEGWEQAKKMNAGQLRTMYTQLIDEIEAVKELADNGIVETDPVLVKLSTDMEARLNKLGIGTRESPPRKKS